MVYFYINQPTYLKTKYFKSWYLIKHVQEPSYYYENFGLKWSFKYSKNIMLSSKP
jgi:hypothetical protein